MHLFRRLRAHLIGSANKFKIQTNLHFNYQSPYFSYVPFDWSRFRVLNWILLWTSRDVSLFCYTIRCFEVIFSKSSFENRSKKHLKLRQKIGNTNRKFWLVFFFITPSPRYRRPSYRRPSYRRYYVCMQDLRKQ